MSLLGIGGFWRLIGRRSWMVLLDVAWMGSLIGRRSRLGGLFGLGDGVWLRARSGVMASGRLWLGGLGISGNGLRVLS